MKRFMLFIGSLTVLLSACGTAGDIEIHDPWVRPTAQGENAAMYFTIHNHSAEADELTGASTTAADMVEIHQSKMENEVAQMNMIPSVPLGAGEEVTFAPGGLHIMLVQISRELKSGEHVGVILHFRNREDIFVNVLVGDAAGNIEDHEHQ